MKDQLQVKTENGPEYADRLRQEFHEAIDGRLRGVILDLDRWAWLTFRKRVLITGLNRTLEENGKSGKKG